MHSWSHFRGIAHPEIKIHHSAYIISNLYFFSLWNTKGEGWEAHKSHIKEAHKSLLKPFNSFVWEPDRNDGIMHL